MAFGEGFKHVDSKETLEDGFYTATIKAAEIKHGNYGDYIQATVEVEGHSDCYPNLFLLNDSPKSGFGALTKEQSLEIWNRNMTKFFKNFDIPEGNFSVLSWVGHKGTITVRPQKKSEYKEIVPYKVQAKKTETKPVEKKESDEIPEDLF